MPIVKRYVEADVDLKRGSVDDNGAARYSSLEQNVPDGFVTDLQLDLNNLEFVEAGLPDGAFGNMTAGAVRALQALGGLAVTGVVGAETRAEIGRWIEHEFSKSQPPPSREPPPARRVDGMTYIAPRVVHFSQGDPEWASRVLGRNSTIKKSGCAITCIAMILRFFGRDADPGKIDLFLDETDGYVGDSVNWSVAGRFDDTDGPALADRRADGGAEELRARLRERISANLPTMARVDYGVDEGLQYNHFVVAVGFTAGGNIIMNDPATRRGDGYEAPTPDNVIETTPRKQGYTIVRLDWYE